MMKLKSKEKSAKEEEKDDLAFLSDLKKAPSFDQLKAIDPLNYLAYRRKQNNARHLSQTEGQTASSLTSTRAELVTSNQLRQLSDDELRK